MGYTAILAKLANERSAENKRIVQLAKDEYGEQFGSTFGYRRHGVWVPKTKAVDIARQYCAIHGLIDVLGDECE